MKKCSYALSILVRCNYSVFFIGYMSFVIGQQVKQIGKLCYDISKDEWWLALESNTRVSSHLELVSWVYLHPTVLINWYEWNTINREINKIASISYGWIISLNKIILIIIEINGFSFMWNSEIRLFFNSKSRWKGLQSFMNFNLS